MPLCDLCWLQLAKLNKITTSEAADSFNCVMMDHLNPSKGVPFEANHEIAVLRASKSLAKTKNQLRRGISSTSGTGVFLEAHNKTRKCARNLLSVQSTRRQQSAFRKNPWSFAESACNESSKLMPTFSKSEGLAHFSNSFLKIPIELHLPPDLIQLCPPLT